MSLSKKQILVLSLVLALVALGVFFVVRNQGNDIAEKPEKENTQNNLDPIHKVVGESVEGRDIESFTYGNGNTHLLFVGGIHGGYEWNSVLLAYRFIDYLDKNPKIIPNNIKVSVIPSANPDGVYEVINKEGRFSGLDVPINASFADGRFNSNGVDLNRNFNCKWEPTSMWRGQKVSAGDEPFSEPEARAIRDFVTNNNLNAVIFWHSKANTVYASECENGIIPETLDIMNVYADAANYRSVESFDAYEITGDAEGWLASIGVPAITVELETRNTIEWTRNLSGIKSLLSYYGNN